MNRHLLTGIFLTLLAVSFALCPQVFSGGGILGQRRRTPQPKKPKATATTAARDYSKFSHGEQKHQGACNTCHKIPTKNGQQARGYPDIADYPDHASCLEPCHDHRKDFFKGALPKICSDCHTKTSPRSDERYAFRNPLRQRQFTIIFPHDKHQNVIASLRFRPQSHEVGGSSLMKSAHAVDDKTLKINNCDICHAANTKLTAAAPPKWIGDFAPFKGSPENHASCFNCHWSGQSPTRDNCAGCHRLAAPYDHIETPKRISANFTHTREQHVKECTACHINITKAATLQGLKPDVPIYPSCATSSCHQNVLGEELNKYNKSQPGGFKCVKCHTSDVGSKKPPNSHSLALLGQ